MVSDICNEPDDSESLVRLLVYANEFDLRGLVACTSTWLRNAVHPQEMELIVKEYGKVVSNLNAHVHPDNAYPSVQDVLGLIKAGPPVYGKKALAEDYPLSEGAQSLIEQLRASNEPLWILCWGGTNVLAQALQHIQKTLPATEASQLYSKLRVYAISDQDDTGLWIRINFPDVLYICSVHGWGQYGQAAWIGISGTGLDNGGPDDTKISSPWLKENIQQIGPLGSVYPDKKFVMEGDTPTFLYLMQNGLGSPEHP